MRHATWRGARAVAAGALLATVPAAAGGQEPDDARWKPELRPFLGATIPTGAMRHAITTDLLFGLQGAAELRPTLHLVGSLGITTALTKHVASDRDVTMLQYDAGAEFGRPGPRVRGWRVRPFVGIGAGARTWLYAASALRDRTCAVAYGAVGTEFQVGTMALRAELRDNLFCYRSPVRGVASSTRNDLGFALGFTYHLR